jgi:hypothetical protein
MLKPNSRFPSSLFGPAYAIKNSGKVGVIMFALSLSAHRKRKAKIASLRNLAFAVSSLLVFCVARADDTEPTTMHFGDPAKLTHDVSVRPTNDDMFVATDWDKLPSSAPDDPPLLSAMVAQIDQRVQGLLHQDPDPDMTNAQRANLLACRREKISAAQRAFLGKVVKVPLRVVDVISSDQVPHSYVVIGLLAYKAGPGLSDSDRQQIGKINGNAYQQQLSLSSWHTRALANAKIEFCQYDTYYTEEDKEKAAAGLPGYKAACAEINAEFRDKHQQIETDRTAAIASIKDNTTSMSPKNVVYMFSDSDDVLRLKRNEQSLVYGAVWELSLFVYNGETEVRPFAAAADDPVHSDAPTQDLSGAYVGAETLLKFIPHSTTTEPTTEN